MFSICQFIPLTVLLYVVTNGISAIEWGARSLSHIAENNLTIVEIWLAASVRKYPLLDEGCSFC
jgi:hypothetical protein